MTKTEIVKLKLLSVLVIVLATFLALSTSVFAVQDDEPGDLSDSVISEEETIQAKGLDNPEELLEDYIEVITEQYATKQESVSFEAKNGIVPDRLRGSRLKGAEKRAYDLLKAAIEKIAAGESDEAFVELTFGQIFSEEDMSRRFTSEQLGGCEIAIWNDDKGEYELTGAAKEATADMFVLDTQKVFQALIYDCPYALFWFDKTAGMTWDRWALVGAEKTNGEWKTYCLADGEVNFYFAVSEDYTPEKEHYVYEFNTGVYRSVQTDKVKIQGLDKAVEKAVGVVAYASTNKQTDVEKLDYYRGWICNEVSYNNAAVNNNQAYGDPWQLIYVFDEDNKTNVVCEGYSKAFKYLCDMTVFDGNVDCRTVTGNMSGGTGAGAHMWNLVEIGSKNYLVDVTNCDSGTIGYPNLLFMVGYDNAGTETVTETPPGTGTATSEKYTFKLNTTLTFTYDFETVSIFDPEERQLSDEDYDPCDHNWGEEEIISNPSCTSPGKKSLTCTICKKTKTEEIEAKGHVEVDIPEVPATCTEAGSTAGKKCSTCNAILVEPESIEALNHDLLEVAGSAEEATCTQAGKHANEKCSRCDYEKAGAVIPALGHAWDEGQITEEPGEDTRGEKVYHCTRVGCGETEKEIIPSLNEQRAQELEKLKDEAIAAIQSIDVSVYSGSEKTAVINAINAAIEAINNATAIDEIDLAKSVAKTLIAKQKTDAQKKADAEAEIRKNGVLDPSLPKVSIKAPGKAKKSFTAKWKKLSKKNQKKVQGIEVEYATDKQFTQGSVIKPAKKNKTSLKIKGLKSKKTYWVRVRTYKKVGGIKYYSHWSKAKKVKVK